jgi:zinc/manganese transport system substrate-binding protein
VRGRRAARLGAAALWLGAAAGVAAPPPLRVATLGTVLGEIAAQVGGDRVQVTNLIRPGIDPHTFSPSPSDMRALVDADVVLASGLGLEGYLDRVVARLGPGGRVVAVGDALPGTLATARGEKDPHWWHSIASMLRAVDLVRAAFAAARPADGAAFEANARAYEGRLRDLQAWVVGQIGALPPARRQLVTSHDAFGYFARDYGFTVHALSGLSTEGEADARHVAALIDRIRRDRIRSIFAESSVNPRLVANLLEETEATLGGTLYADGLGPPGSGAETYEAMYRHNVRTIVDGLSGP